MKRYAWVAVAALLITFGLALAVYIEEERKPKPVDYGPQLYRR